MIAPLHDTAEPEAAPPQAAPLGPQGSDEEQAQQGCTGGEESHRGGCSEAATGLGGRGGGGGEARDGVCGRHLERGGAVAELVVQDLGVGAGDLEVAQGVGVEAVYAGRAGCYLTWEIGAGLAWDWVTGWGGGGFQLEEDNGAGGGEDPQS